VSSSRIARRREVRSIVMYEKYRNQQTHRNRAVVEKITTEVVVG